MFRQAHDCCFSNKEQIEKSEKCGCFSCCEIFTPSEITDYFPDEPPTAECPFCHIDSVIGDASGFPITKEFLKKMKKRYF
ncbi:cytoplasmic protein [Prevotella copri]|uniref:Cytoplasmic protein n=1 Tax=Segatella copri TaxID=165179 RepID=A0AAW4N9W9_9BACT|nr:cytoplasmic protein [Segatella copri]MBV3398064.1 cytoplasmic protein [Segatella copri]MBV3407788.1 cytoplasmic protein [Segatella copri]MBV3410981.1 cytoplasmic protein [Segatella copri]MBV3419503.1 cytoplasmic protein [Segatella copri]